MSEELVPVVDGTTTTADREIVVTRVFDAPRELVFDAFTQAGQVAQWWGPRGFTTTVHEMDVRPGGVWRFVMHGPDGVDYPNVVTYVEVERPERLLYLHGDDEQVEAFRASVVFDQRDGKTAVTMTLLFDSAAERERVIREVGAVEGANQTLERLSEFLADGAKG